MTTSRSTVVLAGLLVAAIAPAVQAEVRRYEPVVLPVPSGCQSYTVGHGIDNQMRVLGFVTCDDFTSQQAALWIDGERADLGTLGGPSSFALGSMGRGTVVGTAETPEPYEEDYFVARPFAWDGDGLRDLGTLGGPLGGALAINAKGTIVGACQPGHEDSRLGRLPMRACAWEQGRVRDLGDLGGPEAAAYDINARGWIVGDSDTAEPLRQVNSFVRHAFLHDGEIMSDLGTLGGPSSLAWAINDRGAAVGFSLTGTRAANGVAEQHAVLWEHGETYDLGTLGGELSRALGINNRGVIVGWSWRVLASGARDTRATLWEDGTPADLNELIPDTDWLLREATAVNEQGVILANARGQAGAGWRAVLLVPVSPD